MVGQKEVEIVLLGSPISRGKLFERELTTTEGVRLTGQCKEDYGLTQCLRATQLPESTYGDGASPDYRINHQASAKTTSD
jgi:hypothetical protein